ncbi:MAG TPA: Ig-like domain-containing protein [Gemmatimonadales bacterium]|nr:Ig-like domain-containing protein [Gemmatimonadales bacterium]
MRALRHLLLPSVILLAGPKPGWGQSVTELYVSPDTLSLTVGQKQGLAVQAFDSNGNAILRLTFHSTDDAVVVVEGTGTVTAVGPGAAQVLVSAGRKSKSVYVLVTGEPTTSSSAATIKVPAPLPEFSSVVVQPAAIYALPGEKARAVAFGVRSDGSMVGRLKAVWKSIRPDIASVGDTSGIVTAIVPGEGSVQAMMPNGLAAMVPVFVSADEFAFQLNALVLQVSDSFTLSAVVPKQRNRHLVNGDLQWASTNLAIAQVSTEGEVKGVAPGQAEIIVRGFGQERRLPVNVYPPIARFLTSPKLSDTVRVPLLASREFKVRAEAADSTVIPDVPFDWVLADTSIAAFNRASGLLTSKQLGTTTLSFAARGFAPLSWTIQVVAATLGLDRSRVALAPGQKTKLSVSYLNEQKKPGAAASGVTWSSNNPAVARIGADGTVQAIAPGRAVISAIAGPGDPVTAIVMVSGDMLLVSSRFGKLGVFSLVNSPNRVFIPIVADSTSNNIDPAYSPDRTRLAFSSDRAGGNYDIYVADADGQNATRLTNDPGPDLQPVWTPDGHAIVFTGTRGGVKRIMMMQVNGTGLHELAGVPGGAQDPVISPNGNTLAFTGFPTPKGPQSDIYTLSLTGTGAPVVVMGAKDRQEHLPAFLPTGELVYVVDRKEKKELNLVMRRSSAAPLVSSDAPITAIAISPDGSRIAWSTSRTIDKNRTETALLWRTLPTGPDTPVQLLPGERVASPSF